mgnify:FL=1
MSIRTTTIQTIAYGILLAPAMMMAVALLPLFRKA